MKPKQPSKRPGETPSSSAAKSDATPAPRPPATGPDDEATVISARPPVHTTTPEGRLSPHKLGETLIGRRLAHFQLTGFVGGGGMGAVFRATDTMLNRTVAVKVLSRDQSDDDETVRRFRNEAQSAARLDHENIARVYYVGEDDGWYFIVFEFIEGRNLRELVADDGVLSLAEALRITLQIADAIDHASRRDVVHRDIKPSNVLITSSGRAKLVDMGLARLQPLTPEDEDLTASGVTLGTFDYISPEQARDPRTADVRSDIYSLGCTLFFLLTGRPPFPKGTVLQKLLSHSSQSPPDPRDFRRDLPPEISDVVKKMLAKKPTDRYADTTQLIKDLLLLGEQLGLQPTLHGEPVWISSPSKRKILLENHLPWLLPISLLLAFVFAIEPLWLRGNTGSGSNANTLPEFTVPESSTSTPSSGETTRSDPPITTTSPGTDVTQNDEVVAGDAQPAKTDENATISQTTTDDNSSAQSVIEANNNDSKRIIVGPLPENIADYRARFVEELDLAFQLAIADPTVTHVEIRRNGIIPVSPVNFRLPRRSLTIQAATGFAPVLRPSLGLSENADAEAALAVTDGELTLRGIHVLATLTNAPMRPQAIFALNEAQLLRLDRCTITVENSTGSRFERNRQAAVFDIDREDVFFPNSPDSNSMLREIELNDCIIRGEATVLNMPEAVPLRLRWRNGLLATSQRLLRIGGAEFMPARGEQITIDLEHVTANMDQGLAELFNTNQASFLMNVSIWATNSIFVCQPEATFILQTGRENVASFMAQLEYIGDHNFYETVETFWRISPDDSSVQRSFDFESWRTHWSTENRPRWNRVEWRQFPATDTPTHQHRVADYTLTLQGNPAVKSSQDRQDAGFQHGLLPRLPERR